MATPADLGTVGLTRTGVLVAARTHTPVVLPGVNTSGTGAAIQQMVPSSITYTPGATTNLTAAQVTNGMVTIVGSPPTGLAGQKHIFQLPTGADVLAQMTVLKGAPVAIGDTVPFTLGWSASVVGNWDSGVDAQVHITAGAGSNFHGDVEDVAMLVNPKWTQYTIYVLSATQLRYINGNQTNVVHHEIGSYPAPTAITGGDITNPVIVHASYTREGRICTLAVRGTMDAAAGVVASTFLIRAPFYLAASTIGTTDASGSITIEDVAASEGSGGTVAGSAAAGGTLIVRFTAPAGAANVRFFILARIIMSTL